MSVKILRRSHGFQLDHVALGVPDTREGAAWVEAQTGATVHLRDPNPNLWYWSGCCLSGQTLFLRSSAQPALAQIPAVSRGSE
ncbi:hypothetical protein GTA62_18340 [Roseobacter sp. HKCCD9010]|uniref:hypothetical protein n=1 Tax=unclassified Roseobacter TaxID=196798 RepID=UPI001491152A|nr:MULTISPECIES: hypothetical protein [unclassified Roseobacter]MBF9051734.1 hypothetical protein [Rhodobacterales bacterium HKCCD4356]NNV13727.1 hypothetical protein [Roseobacter sp. HKCCD7357]NNV17752.1 hypothetical protein [Roseobacter sp. HKCCD8768]NNV27359.1 hypothetical protein [Roseobacter sp. HKCCD8192]NNV31479.1 hypothetical protein [Roseobacter sp. HKCCD9061]